MTKKVKAKKGRSGREPEEGERIHIGFRVTPALKRHIEQVAHENGRSISQEAELRLEQSFNNEEFRRHIDAKFGELMYELKHTRTMFHDIATNTRLLSECFIRERQWAKRVADIEKLPPAMGD